MSTEMTIQPTVSPCVFGDAAIGATYSSFSPEDVDGKIRLYNAINSPDGKVADNINQVINLTDVVISYVKLAGNKEYDENDERSKDKDAFRVILIDDEGRSYTATSQGLYNSMCTLRTVFGNLHFDQPLPIVIRQIKTKNGNTLTVQISK